MIVYRKGFLGLHLLLRCAAWRQAAAWGTMRAGAGAGARAESIPLVPRRRLYGSAIVRTFVWGFIAALQTGLMYLLISNWELQFFAGGRVRPPCPARPSAALPGARAAAGPCCPMQRRCTVTVNRFPLFCFFLTRHGHRSPSTPSSPPPWPCWSSSARTRGGWSGERVGRSLPRCSAGCAGGS